MKKDWKNENKSTKSFTIIKRNSLKQNESSNKNAKSWTWNVRLPASEKNKIGYVRESKKSNTTSLKIPLEKKCFSQYSW